MFAPKAPRLIKGAYNNNTISSGIKLVMSGLND